MMIRSIMMMKRPNFLHIMPLKSSALRMRMPLSCCSSVEYSMDLRLIHFRNAIDVFSSFTCFIISILRVTHK
jgi:hypothetical protein